MKKMKLFVLMAMMLLAITTQAQRLRPGRYVIESAVNRHYCIDLDNGAIRQGGTIWCYSYNGGTAQIWDVVENRDGTYSIFNCKSDQYCITADYGMRDGTRLWLKKDINTDQQKWRIESRGQYYVIRSKVWDKYVVDLYTGRPSDTQQISMWTENNTDAQLWHFRRVDDRGGDWHQGANHGGAPGNHGGHVAPPRIEQPKMQVIDAGGEVAFTVPRAILNMNPTYYYWDISDYSKIERVETSKSSGVFRGIKATPSTIVTYKYKYRSGEHEESGSIPFSVKINKVAPTAVVTDQEASVGWGQQEKLRVWFEPKYAEGSLQYNSDNPAVVSVDSYGNITGNKLGQANIFITSENGLTTEAHVYCVVPQVKKLKVGGYDSDRKLYPGDQVQLTCTFSPEQAEPTLQWYSGDSSIATVDQHGLVTIVGSGTVHIYCTDTKTGKKDDIKLKPKKSK